jgi:hypothetical protein
MTIFFWFFYCSEFLLRHQLDLDADGAGLMLGPAFLSVGLRGSPMLFQLPRLVMDFCC